MKIYTKTGDSGETSLFGGKRVKKDNLRIESYGEVDELNSFIGIVISHSPHTETDEILTKIQSQLFNLGADLSTPHDCKYSDKIKRISDDEIEILEKWIDSVNEKIPPLNYFILPGGVKTASFLHAARTICRRAERKTVAIDNSDMINEKIIVYLNRLSDLLFVLARFENHLNNVQETPWKS